MVDGLTRWLRRHAIHQAARAGVSSDPPSRIEVTSDGDPSTAKPVAASITAVTTSRVFIGVYPRYV